jgi:transposase
MEQNSMLQMQTQTGRIVGLDGHPDSFTAALVQGRTPAEALTQQVFHKVPIGRLLSWAQKNTTAEDLIVLEASGNSFEIVRRLQTIQRKALVLESCHLGKLKEAHANNDKISAVRIAKAFLAGTAKTVWVPDLKTQQRRDTFHMHRKTVKRSTQTINRLNSYLSDHGVRLDRTLTELTEADAMVKIRQARSWEAGELRLIEGLMLEVQAASQQRRHWEQSIAAEVLADPLLLSLTRLCGVRDIVAFALGAIVGDITRFARPKSLIKFLGLHPAFDQSGQNNWSGGVGLHGRQDVRSLLIESAQAILRADTPLSQWGRKLLARKSSYNLAVAAVARKLAVAIWYLMKGKWERVQNLDRALTIKIGKIISKLGKEGLEKMGKDRKTLRKEVQQLLKTGRTDYVEPRTQSKPSEPSPEPLPKSLGEPIQRFQRPTSLAEEYGLR